MSAPVIVAAAAGTTCMVISISNVQDQDRPLDANGRHRATARPHLVAAWKIYSDDSTETDWPAEPVFVSHIVTGCDLVLLPLPGGGWWIPLDGGCRGPDDDFADLIADVERLEAEAREARPGAAFPARRKPSLRVVLTARDADPEGAA